MNPHKKNLPLLGFFSSFEDLLNQKHSLYILANQVGWLIFDETLLPLHYPNNGRPAKPIRNISNKSVRNQWAENFYDQYLCGDQNFVKGFPCKASEFVDFR